jgi:hypothetical protein
MNSLTTPEFWECYNALPESVRSHADVAYKLWRDNPAHPSIMFKRVSRTEPLYSARIGLVYRALALFEGDTVTWFWIGAHSEYMRLLK